MYIAYPYINTINTISIVMPFSHQPLKITPVPLRQCIRIHQIQSLYLVSRPPICYYIELCSILKLLWCQILNLMFIIYILYMGYFMGTSSSLYWIYAYTLDNLNLLLLWYHGAVYGHQGYKTCDNGQHDMVESYPTNHDHYNIYNIYQYLYLNEA